LVEVHSKSLEKLLDGGESAFYNAAMGQGYSNKEVIDTVEKVTGLKVKVKVVAKRPGDADALFASNEKIKKALNWKPKYNLEDIVKSAYLWHKNHPSGYSV
jgi:UDP-glucose 4-epimerase